MRTEQDAVLGFYGLTGRWLDRDYYYISRFLRFEELPVPGFRRACCEVLYDPIPATGERLKPQLMTFIVPVGLQDYRAYRLLAYYRFRDGESLTDIALPGVYALLPLQTEVSVWAV